MSALQIWLQNHNRKLTQDAIDEALMEYIGHIEKQRDELLAALKHLNSVSARGFLYDDPARVKARAAIASAKGDKNVPG